MMSENPTEYRFQSLYVSTKHKNKDLVLSSLYAKTVLHIAELAIAHMLISKDEVLDYAIEFTDQLIEKVGEKL